ATTPQAPPVGRGRRQGGHEAAPRGGEGGVPARGGRRLLLPGLCAERAPVPGEDRPDRGPSRGGPGGARGGLPDRRRRPQRRREGRAGRRAGRPPPPEEGERARR